MTNKPTPEDLAALRDEHPHYFLRILTLEYFGPTLRGVTSGDLIRMLTDHLNIHDLSHDAALCVQGLLASVWGAKINHAGRIYYEEGTNDQP